MTNLEINELSTADIRWKERTLREALNAFQRITSDLQLSPADELYLSNQKAFDAVQRVILDELTEMAIAEQRAGGAA